MFLSLFRAGWGTARKQKPATVRTCPSCSGYDNKNLSCSPGTGSGCFETSWSAQQVRPQSSVTTPQDSNTLRLCVTLKFVFGEISWLEISMFGVRLGIRWCQVFTRSLSTSGSFKVKQYQLKFTWTATASVYFLCMTDILDNNYLGGNKKIWQT